MDDIGVWRVGVELANGGVYDEFVLAPTANTALVIMGAHIGDPPAPIVYANFVPVADRLAPAAINFGTDQRGIKPPSLGAAT
jgi:hypothetical protein